MLGDYLYSDLHNRNIRTRTGLRGNISILLGLICLTAQFSLVSGCKVAFFGDERTSSSASATRNGSLPQVEKFTLEDGSEISNLVDNTFYSRSSRVVLSGSCQDNSIIEVNVIGGASNAVSRGYRFLCVLGRYEGHLSQTVGSTSYDSFLLDVRSGVVLSEIADVVVYSYSDPIRFKWIIDSIAPSAPVLSSELGSSKSTSGNSLDITGTCEVGSTVTLSSLSQTGASSVLSSVLCTNGSFLFTVSSVVDGVIHYLVSQKDVAGNSSANTPFAWTRQTIVFVGVLESSSSSSDFGAVTVGSSSTQSVTLTNTGNDSLSLGTLPSSLGSSLFSIASEGSNRCISSQTLAPQGSCQIYFKFSPVTATASGSTESGSATIHYSSGSHSNSVVISLSGVGGVGLLSITPSGTYGFGSVDIGAASTKVFTIQNTGNGSVTVQTFSNSNDLGLAQPFSLISGGTCQSAQVLAASASCTLVLAFTPNLTGASTGGLSVSYTNGLASPPSPLSITLTGTATQAHLVFLGGQSEITSYDYGTVTGGTSQSYTVTVKNTGTSTATFNSISTTSLGLTQSAFSVANGGTCNSITSLSANSTCSLILTFSPSSSNQVSQVLALSYNTNSLSTPQLSSSLTLSGTGVYGNLVITGTANQPEFNGVITNNSAYATLIVTNSGNAVVTLGSFSLSLSTPFSLVSGSGTTCYQNSTQLSAGGSCNQVVKFAPTSAGSFSRTLTLTYSNGSSPNTTYSLSGIALASPSTPTITSVTPSPVPSASPSLTASSSAYSYNSSSNTVAISGACTSGNTITLDGDSSSSTVCTSNNTYSFTLSAPNSPSYSDGTQSFSITQASPAPSPTPSVLSSAATFQWVRDSLPPAPPTIFGANPLISGDSSFTISGSCEPGATVRLKNASLVVVASAQCSSLGVYTFTYTAAGNYTLTQLDLAMNESSPPLTFTWTQDTSVPLTPTITSPSPLAAKVYTNQNSYSFTGSCANGNTVTILDSYNGQTYTPSSTGGITCQSSNSFSVTVSPTPSVSPSADPGSEHPIIVYQTDINSGLNSSNAQFLLIHDTIAPDSPSVIYPSPSPYYAGGSSMSIGGYCSEEGSTITAGGTGSGTESCTMNSFRYKFSNTSADNTNPGYTYSFTQTDFANNTSSAGSLKWLKDSTRLSAPEIITPSVNIIYSNQSSLTVTGYCNKGNAVKLSGNVQASEVSPGNSLEQNCGNGQWKFTITKSTTSTSASPFRFSFTQSNPNYSTDSPASVIQWVRDATAPVITVNMDTPYTAGNPITSKASTVKFSFSADKSNMVQYQCKLDTDTSYSSCISPVYYTPSNGSRTFSVKGYDSAGNVGTSTLFSWTQSTTQTLALYRFDSASPSPSPFPTSLADSGTLGNDLVVSNATGLTLLATGGPITGSLNYLNMASDSGHLYANTSASLGMSGNSGYLQSIMTLEMWVNPGSVVTAWGQGGSNKGKVYVLASKTGNVAGSFGWQLGVKQQSNGNSGEVLSFKMSGNGGGSLPQEVTSTGFNFDAGTWYHVAVVFNKGTVSFYVAGNSKGGGSISGSSATTLPGSTQNLRIGSNNGATTFDRNSNQFQGGIDELRISQSIRYTGTGTNVYTVPSQPFTAD